VFQSVQRLRAETVFAPFAGALRELLYGSAELEQRIDRFVAAYETTFHRDASR
jgi:hypothetical protein